MKKKAVVDWNLQADKKLFQLSQKICGDVTWINLSFKIIGNLVVTRKEGPGQDTDRSPTRIDKARRCLYFYDVMID